ncbi:MAG: glycosyltransferase family 2 protein [Candidatus Shapirobacteria bacterium]|jgi:glycosyltransferase involved in cell wall biosynthesis
MKKTKILVVIPTYNCSSQIGRVIQSFDQNTISRIYRIAVFNDKSKDDTEHKALEAIKKKGSGKMYLYSNDQNRGLGGTHKAGYLLARKLGCSHMAIIHGDDQAETKELNNLIDVADKDGQIKAVLGSRFMKRSRLVGYSTIRILGNKVLNFLFTLVTLKRTLDLGSGLNLFSLKAFSENDFSKLGDGLTFNVDLLLLMYRNRVKIKFVPITWKETDQISNAKIFKVGSIIIKSLIRWRLGIKNPLVPKNDYSFKEIK